MSGTAVATSLHIAMSWLNSVNILDQTRMHTGSQGERPAQTTFIKQTALITLKILNTLRTTRTTTTTASSVIEGPQRTGHDAEAATAAG